MVTTSRSASPQADEWLLCSLSFAYWLHTYGWAYDATRCDWVRFRPWPAQRPVADLLEAERLVVILKARQLGLSWLAAGFGLWLMLFHPAATVLLFSRRDDEAVHLLSFRLAGMYRRLPGWMQAREVAADNDHEFRLSNGSAALAFPTTGGRSYTATLAIVDEADHAGDLDALLRAVKPTIDAGGRLILVSTVDKSQPQSAFKRIYQAAVAGENGYRPVFLPWSARPDRDAAWYEAQRRDILARTGSLDDLFQEYPASDFEALAPRALDRRFAPAWLARCDASHQPPAVSTQPPPAIPGLAIYEPPAAGAHYVIGADPAEGNPQSDPSAASVVDLHGSQVAAWAGRVEPAAFAGQIAAVSAYYNAAPVLVERNNHGHAVLLWLRECSAVRCLPGQDGRPGWTTTGRSKPLAYDAAAEMLAAGETAIRDRETLAELANIVGATLAAPAGLHDDRATAHVLALAALRFCSVGPAVSGVAIPPVDIIALADRGPFA